MSTARSYRLCGGPMDGQRITVEHLPLKVWEAPNPRWDAKPDDPIERGRTGTYSERTELYNALQWDGWQP